jgi:parallel beta-helix repeat protein
VISVRPGQDIQALVAASPPASTFLLKAGVHRMQSIRPRNGDSFRGEPGAVLSGARLLTVFTRMGKYWTANGQRQQGVREGRCESQNERCTYPEDVFIDDERLSHVASLSAVGHGTWFFDYDADRIYLGDDPTGRRVETSIVQSAFEATGEPIEGVTIASLTIEKYASAGNTGAILAPNARNWTIAENEIRWNHATGIACGAGSRVVGNRIHHNGQAGIGGYKAADVVIEGNDVAYNNTAHFDPYWGAGGIKMVAAQRLTVRGNTIHHNDGPGLWCDYECLGTVFENNTVEDNAQSGIFYEVSFGGTIRNNTVRRNGFGVANGPARAGILVAASADVSVYGNVLRDNASGILAYQENRGRSETYNRPFAVENLDVHDNTISMASGSTGLIQRLGDRSYYLSRNNRFERNRYELGADASFIWMDAPRSPAEWMSLGQDRSGSFTRQSTPPAR